MSQKDQVLSSLKEEFKHWENLLAGLSEEQITARQLAGDWSIKDVIAHLYGWQRRSVARLDAALHHHEPVVPGWPTHLSPSVDEELDQINAWIYETYRDQPWSSVHQAWREGYLRVLDLGAAIPEPDLLEPGKYPWLRGYALIEVLRGTYEHHLEEHREPLEAWLGQRGNTSVAG